MAAQLLRSSGRPLRRWRVDGVIAATVALAIAGLWHVLPGTVPTGPTVAVGFGLVLASLALVIVGPQQDGHHANVEEAVVAVALVLGVPDLGWAVLTYAVLYPLVSRPLGLVERVRRAPLRKRTFNTAATSTGALTAITLYPALTQIGTSAPLAALAACVAHWVVATTLTALVMSAANDRLRLVDVRQLFTDGLVGAVLSSLVGVALATVADGLVPAAPVAVGVGAVAYLVALFQAPRMLQAAVADEVAAQVPALLTAEDLEAAVGTGAARLLGAERGEIRATPPVGDEVGVQLGDHPSAPWLVVGPRLGATTRFDEWERRLLASYARLAAPARAHVRAADRLRVGNEARAAILQSIGHDLRSPLAVAGSATRTLLEHGDRLDREPREQLVSSIISNLDRSAAILDDLLELERRTVVPDLSDPAAVADVVTEVGEAGGHLVTVVPGPPAVVATDPRLLTRVLDNLVQNAFRHAPGSEVVLWWWEDGAEVTIAVDDGGHGIAEEDRERVLQPFQGTSEHGVGVGLGLHLAKSFAELAGGRLEIGDSDLGGASIMVVLPCAAVGALAPSGMDGRASALGPTDALRLADR